MAKAAKDKNEAPSTSAMAAQPQTKNDSGMIGDISTDEIKALKKEHGTIRRLKVAHKNGDVSVAYLKEADRNTIALALSKKSRDKVLEAGEVLLDNCMVAGDPEVKSNEKLRVAAAMEAFSAIDFLEASSEEV